MHPSIRLPRIVKICDKRTKLTELVDVEAVHPRGQALHVGDDLNLLALDLGKFDDA